MARPAGVPAKMKFTSAAVADLPFAEDDQYIVRDTDLRNFFVVVGKGEKSYTYQVDRRRLGKRHTKRKSVGTSTQIGAAAARKLAKLAIGKLQTSRATPGKAITLGAAWEAFREQFAHQVDDGAKSSASLRSYRHAIEGILGDWQNATLRDLSDGTAMVAARHREISKTHGRASANVTMRCLRIVYNHARKTRMEKGLPADLPTDAINWNQQARRDTGMAVDELADWHRQLRAMGNPIRESFHMMMLLSGSRPNAMRQAKWDWLDAKARTLTFPASVMKGHSDFVMPLSKPMLECLERVREAGAFAYPTAARIYIFPGPGAAGHLADTTEDRKRLSRWGGDLRQSYVTATKDVGLDGYTARHLLNHSVADVHDGYAGALPELMLAAQEKVSKYLMEGLIA